MVDCEFMFVGLKILGLSNSCLTANNITSTATNIIRLLVALRAIASAGLTGLCEWRSCQRAKANAIVQNKVDRARIITGAIIGSWVYGFESLRV